MPNQTIIIIGIAVINLLYLLPKVDATTIFQSMLLITIQSRTHLKHFCQLRQASNQRMAVPMILVYQNLNPQPHSAHYQPEGCHSPGYVHARFGHASTSSNIPCLPSLGRVPARGVSATG